MQHSGHCRGPRWLFCVALLMFCLPVRSAASRPDQVEMPLPDALARALADAHIPASALSILVIDPAGQVRLTHRAEEVREVGSLVKLVTTLVALERLGPNFRFATELMADPLPGRGQRWQVALRGGGDPELRFEDLRQLLRAAEAQGMHHIGGTVHLDAGRFAPEPAATSAIRLDAGRVSATPPAALAVDFAAIEVHLPQAGRGRLLADPPLSILTPRRLPASAGQPCSPDWPDSMALVPVQAKRPGAVAPHILELRGSWPDACPATVLRRSPLPAEVHFAWTLEAAWRALGHRELIRAEAGAAPTDARIRVRHDSRPLAELVRDTNKFSNNMMARALLLDLAAEAEGTPARVAAGARVIRAWLMQRNMTFDELDFENGAGLSHREVLSATHLAALLRYALTSSVAPEFLTSLPIPGEDGTLRTRFGELPGARRLRLKSGALDGVSALAGYVMDGKGGTGIVLCIVNHPQAAHSTPLQAALLDWVLRDESATKVGL